jgi:uncharacterized membrane protein
LLVHQQFHHTGPLPLPSQLADYEAVYPGAAQWIIEQADKNAQHAREMERQAISLERTDMLLHRLLPFGLVAAFLVATVILTFVSPAAGTAGFCATVAGVLIAYLTGRTPPTGQGSDSE